MATLRIQVVFNASLASIFGIEEFTFHSTTAVKPEDTVDMVKKVVQEKMVEIWEWVEPREHMAIFACASGEQVRYWEAIGNCESFIARVADQPPLW